MVEKYISEQRGYDEMVAVRGGGEREEGGGEKRVCRWL